MPSDKGLEDCVVGIDVGGTKLLANLYDAHNKSIAHDQRLTGRDTNPNKLVSMVQEVVEDLSKLAQIRSVGLGFPGLTNSSTGIVRSSVILDGWFEVDLADRVSGVLGVPCVVDNDVNNCARAESAIRGQIDGRDLLFVSVGTGIGGALVLNGQIWRGASGLAGEIGHVTTDKHGQRCVCGRTGCVATVSSGAAIESRLPMGFPTRSNFANDSRLWSTLQESAQDLGVAIGSVLNILSLPLVVIGGGVPRMGQRYVDMVEQSARSEAFPEIVAECRFEPARAGYEAGSIGAGLLARELQRDLRKQNADK